MNEPTTVAILLLVLQGTWTNTPRGFAFEVDETGAGSSASSPAARATRLVDLDGDGLLDRLDAGPGGTLAVSLNRGERQFEEVARTLPVTGVVDLLVSDLNGDDNLDIYLVSLKANVALAGDGSGGFLDVTRELGLSDLAEGIGAERLDIDGDGIDDILLHNEDGDVVFWGNAGGAYDRDLSMSSSPRAPGTRAETTELSAAFGVDRGSLSPAEGGSNGSDRTVPPRRPGDTGGSRPIEPLDPRDGPSSRAPATPVATPSSSSIPLGMMRGCLPTLEDAATGACLPASSTPTLGMLYPLSSELFVDAATGNVGVGTTTPAGALSVVGPNPPPDTSHASFGDSMWRMRRHVGDEVSAGTIDYRGFDPDALSIVGAGIDNGGLPNERHVRIYDRMGVNADPRDGLSLLVSGMGASYSAAFVGGHVGIGTATPSETLDISGGEIRLADQFTGETLHMSVKGPAADVFSRDQPLFINNAGNNQELYLMGSRVGIGTSTPTCPLEIAGATKIRAPVTADDYSYTSPKKGYRGLAGSVFAASADLTTRWRTSTNGYGYLDNDPATNILYMNCDMECVVPVRRIPSEAVLNCDVDLPEGATITDFTVYWYDSGPDEATMTFQLMKKPWFENDATTMATVVEASNTYAPASAVRLTTTGVINEPVVDNFRNAYYVTGSWKQDEVTSTLRFYGCLVSYEVTSAGVR